MSLSKEKDKHRLSETFKLRHRVASKSGQIEFIALMGSTLCIRAFPSNAMRAPMPQIAR